MCLVLAYLLECVLVLVLVCVGVCVCGVLGMNALGCGM